MIIAIVIILAVLWLLGYVPISGIPIPAVVHTVLVTINNRPVTVLELLILLVICVAIGILPRLLQAVASVLLVLWILSELGILAIAGLSGIVLLVIIAGLIVSIFL
jgi:hypothetical protein